MAQPSGELGIETIHLPEQVHPPDASPRAVIAAIGGIAAGVDSTGQVGADERVPGQRTEQPDVAPLEGAVTYHQGRRVVLEKPQPRTRKRASPGGPTDNGYRSKAVAPDVQAGTAARARSTSAWAAKGACRTSDPDTLFVQGAAQNRAKAICMSCVVRTECLGEALDDRIEFGVWGGMTERERRALLRRRPNVESWRRLLETARAEHERVLEAAAARVAVLEQGAAQTQQALAAPRGRK